MTTFDELLSNITDPTGRHIIDPATGASIGMVEMRSVADADAAIDRARSAQAGWAGRSDEERAAALLRAADAIDAASEALAELLSREQGKPLNGPNARFEVEACSGWLRATAATELPGDLILEDETVRAELVYRPVGVVGAIGPWNWPMMITTWQVAPSLRMGNAVVVKPSEQTPLSVLALVRIINEVLPDDVLTVIPGGGDVGSRLTSHPGVDKVMFTGSTETGRAIIRDSAATVKRLTLELGGNDAGIVLPDVDPEAIAQDLFWAAFINSGQTCAALKRLYVHEDVYERVCEQLVRVVRATPMGRGLEEGNLLGPLQNRRQWEVVDRLVEAAREDGATILVGGDPDRHAPGHFYPATLVTDVSPDNPLVTHEQFGPVLPIIPFRHLREAVAMANASDLGLGASVWTSDPDAARQTALQLEAGTVWVNAHGAVHPMIPFGGVKQSGYGLEFGSEGLKAVAVPKVINTRF